jgi:wyosine [tRNA(Phe)-imidazoG37] synthetase (radical SAM superfamily)
VTSIGPAPLIPFFQANNHQIMKYLFGPVNSRRLGLSMGIDIMPAKVCNFNCIYCEVGATTRLTCDRKEYVPTKAILAEIDDFLLRREAARMPDVYTVTGAGEPTLHSGFGRIIRYLKDKTDKPVAVLTNGSLMHRPEVREGLAAADIVVPSLDAARPESFRRVNRPARCVELETVIKGIECFSRDFSGRIWLEILLVKGVNDSAADIDALLLAIQKIGPERTQLNTVARPPLEDNALPISSSEMAAIAKLIEEKFNGPVEIPMDFVKKGEGNGEPVLQDDIIQILKRRPCTAADVCAALGQGGDTVHTLLEQLEYDEQISSVSHNGKRYYQADVHS